MDRLKYEYHCKIRIETTQISLVPDQLYIMLYVISSFYISYINAYMYYAQSGK